MESPAAVFGKSYSDFSASPTYSNPHFRSLSAGQRSGNYSTHVGMAASSPLDAKSEQPPASASTYLDAPHHTNLEQYCYLPPALTTARLTGCAAGADSACRTRNTSICDPHTALLTAEHIVSSMPGCPVHAFMPPPHIASAYLPPVRQHEPDARSWDSATNSGQSATACESAPWRHDQHCSRYFHLHPRSSMRDQISAPSHQLDTYLSQDRDYNQACDAQARESFTSEDPRRSALFPPQQRRVLSALSESRHGISKTFPPAGGSYSSSPSIADCLTKRRLTSQHDSERVGEDVATLPSSLDESGRACTNEPLGRLDSFSTASTGGSSASKTASNAACGQASDSPRAQPSPSETPRPFRIKAPVVSDDWKDLKTRRARSLIESPDCADEMRRPKIRDLNATSGDQSDTSDVANDPYTYECSDTMATTPAVDASEQPEAQMTTPCKTDTRFRRSCQLGTSGEMASSESHQSAMRPRKNQDYDTPLAREGHQSKFDLFASVATDLANDKGSLDHATQPEHAEDLPPDSWSDSISDEAKPACDAVENSEVDDHVSATRMAPALHASRSSQTKVIAVGTPLLIHTYPGNDVNEEPQWFGVEVTDVKLVVNPQEPNGFKVECEIVYDDDPSWVDTIEWPNDEKDVRVPSTQPAQKNVKTPWPPPGCNLIPESQEVSNMLQFFLCQIRAEYAEIVAAPSENPEERCGPSRRSAYEEFDHELQRFSESHGELSVEWRDLASCEPFMKEFLLGKCARGEKWMPWHSALGTHERYILEVVNQLPLLASEREKYALAYAFSGSRQIELFETLIRPMFENGASVDDRKLGRLIIEDPDTAFARDGAMHRRYAEYRKRGKRLHTTAYSCHPPRGSSGDEFVFYVVDRTRRFIHIGHDAFECLKPSLRDSRQLQSDPVARKRSGAELRANLERKLMSFREIGPTMTKMFLVSTHLSYPWMGLLDSHCTVGDGADAAFDFLYPKIGPRLRPEHRVDLLIRTFDHLHAECVSDVQLLPRFNHMLRWVTSRARKSFTSCVPPYSMESKMTYYDLQVNLCEWRKFRSAVDSTCQMFCGRILPPDVIPSSLRAPVKRKSASGKKKRKRQALPDANTHVRIVHAGIETENLRDT